MELIVAKKTSAKVGAKKPALYERRVTASAEWMQSTMHFPKEVHRVLKIYAGDKGITLQAIMAEAIDEWLRKHGQGSWENPVAEVT